MKRFVIGGLVFLASCHPGAASSPPPATATESSDAPAGATARVAGSADEARLLASDATYAELIRSAGRLEGSEEEASSERRDACVARSVEGGLRLEATIAPAIRPIPEPEPRLDSRLVEDAGLVVLSRWGRHGRGNLAIVTLTHLPPILDEPIVAVLVAPRSIHLRATGEGAIAETASEVSIDALVRSIGPAAAAIVVAADARVSVARLREVLDALDTTGHPVALGTVLPAGSRLPIDALQNL